jgi:pyruvate kinase
MPHPEIFTVIEVGNRILLDDGRVVLEVKHRGEDFAETTVIAGDGLSNNKGLNLPGIALPIAALTEKDRADLDFALELGADWIALSFVQRPEDIAEAHELVGGRAAVMAKLEKPSAIVELDAIVALADGIMVARGDLGVEMKPEEVPGLSQGRKAGDRCNADAGINDRSSHTNQSRGIRRGHRGL